MNDDYENDHDGEPEDHDRSARAEMARRAAEAGASLAADSFRTDLTVETKDGKTDVVTEVDRRAQARVIDVIRREFPDEPVVGEENEERETVPADGPAWIVDPIDGTTNYVRHNRVWTTSVAAVVDGEPVGAASVLPAIGDTYLVGPDGVTRNGDRISVSDADDPEVFLVSPIIWWPRDRRDEYATLCEDLLGRFADLRRTGSAQATLAMVADGTIEGAVTNLLANPWDTVAGVAMIREAGGVVTDGDGNRWRHDSRGLVASNGAAHEQLLATARAAEGSRRIR